MDLHDLAKQLERTGVLVRLSGGNDFKAAAWERAARGIEALEHPIDEYVENKNLDKLDGIGKSIAADIYGWAETGTLPRMEKLLGEIPEGLIAWLDISGLGPKNIYKIHKELGITTIEELKEKCRDGSVAGLKGLGRKSADKILASIEWMEQHGGRSLFSEAEAIAQVFVAELEGLAGVKELSVAGSLRRCMETIGDVDILIAADDKHAGKIFDAFTGHPHVTEVLGRGDTKSSVRTEEGIQVDLRIVPQAHFGAALLYFTGSKEHNIALRGRARDEGMALNEYGLYQLDDGGDTDFEKPVKTKTEADIYTRLGLNFVPPELRENKGELEYFEAQAEVELVETDQLRGVLHAHSNWSDGRNTIEEMARACIQRGFEYLGLTDHSRAAAYAGGLAADEVKKQWDEIDALNQQLAEEGLTFRVFKGIESDILGDGSLDYDDDLLEGFDFIIASVHSALEMEPAKMLKRFQAAAAHPCCTMLGHPTGRLLGRRDGNPYDMNALIETAAEHGTAIEINANPLRLDIDWRHGNKMRDCALMSSINPDAHNTEGLDFMRFGVNTARKARLAADAVLNTKSLEEITAWFAAQRG